MLTKKKIINKAFASLLALVLCFGAMGTAPVSADVTFPLEAKAELSVDFLGISEQGAGPAAAAVTGGITSADVGKVFWIGVAVTDSYKLTENFTTNGIYNMEIALDYDPDFVVPCADITGNLGSVNDETAWLSTVAAHNMTNGADALSPLYWNADNYELVSDACIMAADPDTDSHRESAARDGDKMLFISVRTTENSADYRLKGSVAGDEYSKKYLIRLPFKVVSVPAGGIDNQSLKMALGPQTFVLGSGADGYESYAAWEKEDKTEPAVNLKNYIDFKGDVTLFVPEGGQTPLSGISLFEYVEQTADGGGDTDPPEAREYDLYYDREMTESNKGFAVGTLTYYAAVDYDVGAVTLRISPDIGTENLTVYFGDTTDEIPLTADAAGAYIDTGPIQTLSQVDPAVLDLETGTTDAHFGFNNKITLTAYGGTTYTIYIRRYLKPEIVLNYGNSPVGMIMSETTWDEEKKTKAIEEFYSGTDATKNMFKAGYIPSGGNNAIRYTLSAWGDSDDATINMDRNEHAIFVYQRQDFKDPGYTAYDAMGQVVDATTIERTISFYRLKARQLGDIVSEPEEITITGQPSDYTFTEITSNATTSGSYNKGLVNPDVYEMVYSFNDQYIGKTVTATRNIVVLFSRADTNMDIDINSGDLALINKAIREGSVTVGNGTSEKTKNLFVYRTVDTNYDGNVNSGDLALINQRIKGSEIKEAYNALE